MPGVRREDGDLGVRVDGPRAGRAKVELYAHVGGLRVAVYSGNTSTRAVTLIRAIAWGPDLSGTVGGAGGIGGLLSVRETSASTSSRKGLTMLLGHDAKGDITSVWSADGAYLGGYVTQAFGQVAVLSGSNAYLSENQWRLASKPLEWLIGYSHWGRRWYSPFLGRWVSRDPIGEAGGVNLYGSCGNDMVSRLDPWGELSIFLDGTGNDEKATGPDDGITNIFRLFMISADPHKYYIPGVGTSKSVSAWNRFKGYAFGIGPDGMVAKVNEALKNIQAFACANDICKEPIYIYGFSRGAAEARDLANQIVSRYPCAQIKFLGLYDTVSAQHLFNSGERKMNLVIPGKVEHVYQILSRHEQRSAFTPVSIGLVNANWIEVYSDGSHSDIGGGYWDDNWFYAGSNLNKMYEQAAKAGAPMSNYRFYSEFNMMSDREVYHVPRSLLFGLFRDAERRDGRPDASIDLRPVFAPDYNQK